MKKYLFFILGLLFTLIVALNINLLTFQVNTKLNLSNLFLINFAEAENGGTKYEYENKTQEDKITHRGTRICTQSRYKISCVGTGETNCSPTSDWSNWSTEVCQ